MNKLIETVDRTIDTYFDQIERNRSEPLYEVMGGLFDSMDKNLRQFSPGEADQSIFSTGVMCGIVIRASQMFRKNDESFIKALEDARTKQLLFDQLSANSGNKVASKLEELYCFKYSLIENYRPDRWVIHNEFDGDFLSLQPNDLQTIENQGVRKVCVYRNRIQSSCVQIASGLRKIGILDQYLGSELV